MPFRKLLEAIPGLLRLIEAIGSIGRREPKVRSVNPPPIPRDWRDRR